MSQITTPTSAASRVLDSRISLMLANGKTLTGALEHFNPPAKSLVVFDDENFIPTMLTVLAAEAPLAHIALADDEVLLCNWTELRGVPAALVDQGLVELTGVEVSVGMFRLQALVARVI